jgi:hypothetical protein
MKLIGAGLPRTGTMSQKVALEMLGFGPCYHMIGVVMDLTEAPRWTQAFDRPAKLIEILEGYESSVDWPGSNFWAEMADAYPDAKVLLSVRDGASWAKSMRDTVWGLWYDDSVIRHLSDARQLVDPAWKDFAGMIKRMIERSGLGQGDTESMIGAMQRHTAEVQRTVDPKRLLVWEVSEGWEPLCAFLEVPVPDVPFPRANDTETFQQRMIDQAIAAVQSYRSTQLTAATAQH